MSIADRKNTELARKIVEFRATKTIEAINKHIAAKSKSDVVAIVKLKIKSQNGRPERSDRPLSTRPRRGYTPRRL